MSGEMGFPGSAPPPEGVTPDIENPKDKLHTVLYVTQGLTLLFVTVAVALRIYAKKKILGNAGNSWDDWATYISYVLMVGYCITALFMAKNGGGHDQWEIPPTKIASYFKSGYAATIFYAPMAMFVKLALLLITIRVFGAVHRKTIYTVYVLIGIIVAYYGSGVFIKIFICWPISAYWENDTAKCMDQSAIITADAIISVVSDLAILLLPTPLAWSLQLSRKRRLRITGMLAAGGIATGFSVYRLILLIVDGKTTNQTLMFTKVVLSGNAEAGIGLICACLPAINAIIVRAKGGSSYRDQYNRTDRSGHYEPKQGEIMVSRSFQMNSTGRLEDHYLEDGYELGHDEAKLTSDVQANPKTSRYHMNVSRKSESS